MMSKQLLPLLLGLFLMQIACTQKMLPVLKTTTDVLSIRDGDVFDEDSWTISPANKPDIYTANKTSKPKTVTFYSDIDSLTFKIKPRDKYDFLVVLNETDSCFHRIESGLTFQQTADMKYATDTIPFRFSKYNNIVIKSLINQVDSVDLMFHTAAGGDVSVIEEAVAKIQSISLDETLEGVNSWGGGGGRYRYSKHNRLDIGQLHWDDLVIMENKLSGHTTDGKFGPHLFEDKLVEMNFDDNQLVIHSLPPALDSYQKFDLIFKGDLMYIKGDLKIGETVYTNEFLIHSGYSGTILLDDEFVNRNNIDNQLETISESELKDSQGNVLKTKKARLPIFNFGGETFSDMPIGFFAGAMGRQRMSVVGGDVLKRFNIVIDLQNAYIYLKTNQLLESDYTDI